MNEPALPYEQTGVEFEPEVLEEPWWIAAPKCIHCGRAKGLHWLTEDDKVWCVRNTATSNEGQS